VSDIREKLRELLEDPELRQGLTEAFYIGVSSPREFDAIDVADHVRHARGIGGYKTPFEDLPEKLDEVLRLFILDRLPQPSPITLKDLASLAISHLAGEPLSNGSYDESIVRAYTRFVTFALLEVEDLRENIYTE
jgi:hypothetical protein